MSSVCLCPGPGRPRRTRLLSSLQSRVFGCGAPGEGGGRPHVPRGRASLSLSCSSWRQPCPPAQRRPRAPAAQVRGLFWKAWWADTAVHAGWAWPWPWPEVGSEGKVTPGNFPCPGRPPYSQEGDGTWKAHGESPSGVGGGGPGPLQREAVRDGLPWETVGERGAPWCSWTGDPRCGPAGLQGLPPPRTISAFLVLHRVFVACDSSPPSSAPLSLQRPDEKQPARGDCWGRACPRGPGCRGGGGAAHRAEAGSPVEPPPVGGRERCGLPVLGQSSCLWRAGFPEDRGFWELKGSSPCP